MESIVELNRQIGEGCQFEMVVDEGFPAVISDLPVSRWFVLSRKLWPTSGAIRVPSARWSPSVW